MGEESVGGVQIAVIVVTALVLGLFILGVIRLYLMKKSADGISMDEGT